MHNADRNKETLYSVIVRLRDKGIAFFFLPLFFLLFFPFFSFSSQRYATDGGQQESARVSTYSTANGATISLVFALCLLPGARFIQRKATSNEEFAGEWGRYFLGKCLSIIDFIRPLMGETRNYSEDSRDSGVSISFPPMIFLHFLILSPLKRGFLLFLGCVFSLRTLLRGNFFQIYHRIPIVFPREFGIIVFHHFLMPPFSPIRATFFL